MGIESEILSITPLGDCALVVQFESRIDPQINDQVIGLVRAIERRSIPGIKFLIPAYCSLTIGFDPVEIAQDELKLQIGQLEIAQADSAGQTTNETISKRVELPVCYDAIFAIDRGEVEHQTGLGWDELVARHTSRTYRVYMLGFLPGFGYLGDLDPAMNCRRHPTPRAAVAAGSVAIAGRQTGVYPLEAPGGWQIIGRTPMAMYQSNATTEFALAPGDEVRFVPISVDEFREWPGAP